MGNQIYKNYVREEAKNNMNANVIKVNIWSGLTFAKIFAKKKKNVKMLECALLIHAMDSNIAIL